MNKFEEGDDYFAIETSPEGELQVSMSCWDDQSEEINNPLVFKTLGEALNYAKKEYGEGTIVFYDFTAPHHVELKI